MRVRALVPSDIPALDAMAKASGYPYPDLQGPMIEAVHVVVDTEDRPLCAVAAERIVQLYFYNGEIPPHAKLRALRLLHESLPTELKNNGYTGSEAFLPPELVKRFGRRLEKSFGWQPNWASFCRRF